MVEFLGYQLKNLHGNYYDASDVYWEIGLSHIVEECKKQGFEIVKIGSIKSCYQLTLKKVGDEEK